MPRRPGWPRTVAAATAGFSLGTATVVAGALLLYASTGFLSSAGFLIGLAIFSVAAGLWVGAPDAPVPGHRRMLGRWTLAVGAMVVASFMATLWLRSRALQTSTYGPPLAVVLLLAEPAYALGSLLAALEARRRGWLAERWYAVRARDRSAPGGASNVGSNVGSGGGSGAGSRAGGVAVPALLGAAVGSVMAATWLIPALPPGPVFLGAGILLTLAGSLEMTMAGEPKEGAMAERVVIVTGVGARGQVGYALAGALLADGARVAITGRSDAVNELARELGPDALGVVADLTDPAGAERVVTAVRERWGRLDGLVNVAGGLRATGPLAETSPDAWEREIDANARTTFLMSRAALPLLRASRGAVVNFAAPAGERAAQGLGAYSAAKAAVVAMTRALALEEKANGVRVNAIAPGLVDTEQNRSEVGDPAAVAWVTRGQIADVVRFLLGEAASGITGETIHVVGAGLK